MDKRTIVDFEVAGDLWPYLEAWAGQHKYVLKASQGSMRRYQRGTGLWVAPMMVEVAQDGTHVHLEAWVRANFFARLTSFFILPAEIDISSQGLKAVVPRGMARADVNGLLVGLSQPLIP